MSHGGADDNSADPNLTPLLDLVLQLLMFFIINVNFVAEQVGNTNLPGVQAIVRRLQAMGVLEPEQMVDSCLDLLGPVEVGPDTKEVLTEQARQWGPIRWDTPAQVEASIKQTGELLQLIVATREYQFA